MAAGLAAVGQNLRAFGTNPAEGSTFWDRTVKNREFWVSTVVDAAVSVGVGVVAAAAVAGTIALLAGTAAGTILALPAVAVIATAGVAIGVGYGVELSGVVDWTKSKLSDAFIGVRK